MVKGANPRLDATAHQCFLAPGKFIVWCEFQADVDFVTARLQKEGMRVVQYHGRTPDKEKTANLKAFNADPKIDGLVGQWQAGGRGLDMSVASTIINHSHTFKARLRAQAIERASRIGGAPVRVVDIIAPGPDHHILKTTRKRIDVADSVIGNGLKRLLEGMTL
jgi:superfamily II DNA/RNA helicase